MNIINKIMPDRYKEYKGYVFDRLLFNIFLFLVIAYLFFVAWHYDFKLNYYQCDTNPGEYCKNPFYKPLTWENQEYLPSGSYGQKPGWLFWSTYWVGLGGLVVMFLLNHFIHNRHKTKEIIDGITEALNENTHNGKD